MTHEGFEKWYKEASDYYDDLKKNKSSFPIKFMMTSGREFTVEAVRLFEHYPYEDDDNVTIVTGDCHGTVLELSLKHIEAIQWWIMSVILQPYKASFLSADGSVLGEYDFRAHNLKEARVLAADFVKEYQISAESVVVRGNKRYEGRIYKNTYIKKSDRKEGEEYYDPMRITFVLGVRNQNMLNKMCELLHEEPNEIMSRYAKNALEKFYNEYFNKDGTLKKR